MARDQSSNAAPVTPAAAELAPVKPSPSEQDTPSAPIPAAPKDTNSAPTPAASANTNSSDTAPEPGMLVTNNLMPTNQVEQLREFQHQLEIARTARREKNCKLAAGILVGLLQTNAPPELMRPALFELALVNQDDNQLVKAQRIFAQFVQTYPEDPSVPEILLRQGLLYRQMGVNALAISKFYAVMSSALNLKLGEIAYYQTLVLRAQTEIADTFYLEARYEEASDYFGRLLKAGAAEVDKPEIHYKLVRSLYCLTNYVETISQAQVFLGLYPESPELPEVRFLLASTLKKLGRNADAMKQVLLLLQSQQEIAKKNPESWIYWQRRAGNEIANQLYKEGDNLDALEIYLNLAEPGQVPGVATSHLVPDRVDLRTAPAVAEGHGGLPPRH